jgi:hypothetical protein
MILWLDAAGSRQWWSQQQSKTSKRRRLAAPRLHTDAHGDWPSTLLPIQAHVKEFFQICERNCDIFLAIRNPVFERYCRLMG